MERPNTIGTRERAWQRRQKGLRNMQRRTRRSTSTMGGAAPGTIIGRADADRAGARPYRATGAKARRDAHRRLAHERVPCAAAAKVRQMRIAGCAERTPYPEPVTV